MIGKKLLNQMNDALKLVKEIDKQLEENHLYNEYEIIDWQDELNQLSVKYVE